LHYPTTSKKRLKSAFKSVAEVFFDHWQTLKARQRVHHLQKDISRHGSDQNQGANLHAKNVPPI